MFHVQNCFANDLLKKPGVLVILKTTRSGCTMSLIKACCESGKKVAIFTPTIRIMRQIEEVIPKITRSSARIAPILSNPELCMKLEPNLQLKFQFKENCSNCEYNGKPRQCVFQDLLINEFDVYCLTYAKLQSLQRSKSKDSKLLLAKLQNCDVFVFDEFTAAVVNEIPTIVMTATDDRGVVSRIREHLRTAFKVEFEFSDKIVSKGLYEESTRMLMESGFWGIAVDQFLTQFEHIRHSGIHSNFLSEFLPERMMKNLFNYGWSRITKLTKEGRNTAVLQNVLLIAFSREIILTSDNGNLKATPRLEDALGYLTEFCETLATNKLLLAVDSYQPSVNFDKIFKKPAGRIFWGYRGDPLRTNNQQLVICDSAHWGSTNFLRDRKLQDKVKLFINKALELFPASRVLVVATNKRMAAMINKWNLPKNNKVTWFRSDLMRGVSVEDRRVMICVGGPYIPRKSYDASAQSFRIEAFAKELDRLDENARILAISKILRLDSTKSEFINSIGRVKDPAGQDRSVVFTLGMQRQEVDVLLQQNVDVSKPILTEPFKKGGMIRDAVWIAKVWLDHKLLPHPYEYLHIDDLPIIARIISRTRNKISIRASEVAPRLTDLIVGKAELYEALLKEYNVKTVEKQGGIAFCPVQVTLENFPAENSIPQD